MEADLSLLLEYSQSFSNGFLCFLSVLGSCYFLCSAKQQEGATRRRGHLAIALCLLSLACLSLMTLLHIPQHFLVLYWAVVCVFFVFGLAVLFFHYSSFIAVFFGVPHSAEANLNSDYSASKLEATQQELEQEIDAANRMRQRMQSIFESAPNGMLVVRKSGIIAQANTLAESIFHYPQGGMVGLSIEELVPKEHRQQHTSDREGYVRAPTKRMMGDRKDLYGVCLDGHKVPVEIGLNPIEGSYEEEIVATIVDISERKKYQGFIERRNTDLENTNRELQEFAFIASHDLREPLRKIIAFSRLLQSDDYGQFSEEGKEYSGYVVDAAERMRTLLDSLLSYSRVTSMTSEFERTDLNALIDDVCADLQLVVEESQAQITVAPLDSMNVDASQMRQVMQNLIGNAIKYRRADIPPEIVICAEKSADSYRLMIKDNGIGFENEYAEQIFEVFKRLHGRDHYPGTGMGLAICRKIIARHHGRMWAESVEGKGSVFYIDLPLAMQKELPSE